MLHMIVVEQQSQVLIPDGIARLNLHLRRDRFHGRIIRGVEHLVADLAVHRRHVDVLEADGSEGLMILHARVQGHIVAAVQVDDNLVAETLAIFLLADAPLLARLLALFFLQFLDGSIHQLRLVLCG